MFKIGDFALPPACVQFSHRPVVDSLITYGFYFFYFLCFFGIFAPARRAVSSAIATACFCGLPAFISRLMFRPTAAFDLDFSSGIFNHSEVTTASIHRHAALSAVSEHSQIDHAATSTEADHFFLAGARGEAFATVRYLAASFDA